MAVTGIVARRSPLLALGAAFLSSLVLTTPATGRDPIALGISTPPGDDIRLVDRFTRATGRLPALWSIWVQWGQRAGRRDCSRVAPSRCAFPTAMAQRLAARGVTPVVWWEPVDPARWDGTYSSHHSILSGRHDSYIRTWARDARQFGRRSDSPVILRFAHEHNGDFFPWGVGHHGNTARSFKRAWRYVWRIFRDEGALPHVRFLWSVTKQRCPRGCDPFAPFYPGDRYVDYVGFSAFNWGSAKQWKPMARIVRRPIRLLTRITDKPIVIAELASSPWGGNRARWIRTGYRTVHARWPAVAAILYLDTSQPRVQHDHPDWRLQRGSDRRALRAYAAIARDPRFAGSID